MTIDLQTFRGRARTIFRAISPAGYIWLSKTFILKKSKNASQHEVDNEDADDIVRNAKAAGLEVD